MKISLNWLTKNRNKVRIFYLKNYTSVDELYNAISSNKESSKKVFRNFNLKRITANNKMEDDS
jgi:hypothetical protein